MATAAQPSPILLSSLPTQKLEKLEFGSDESSNEADHHQMVISCSAQRGSLADVLLLPEFTNENIVLNNKYEYVDSLDMMIGMGAYGAVFKGIDQLSHSPVAIKRMPRVHVKESELKVIRNLKSNYLVGVLDICRLDDLTCCLVMDLCDSDLDQHMRNISSCGRLNAVNFRLLMDNIARGYKALYELKIVHRDIKPQNILVTYKDNSKQIAVARITDFGIARTLENDGEELCNVAGTFYYMAPEVGANLLKTCQYDFKVDMWSIGCVLYQCVTGTVPFDECSLCKLFLYTAGENYEAYDPPELPENIDEEVGTIIHSLLEIEPSHRMNPNNFFDRATTWSQKIF